MQSFDTKQSLISIFNSLYLLISSMISSFQYHKQR